ncbi:hypothetical protein DPX16_18179 [Anabarilius grahami]|uniref:Uncharacterized protein n=1 Tax=Anabarilius grahami TaxID=495550 RepID=A0A3N0Y7X9_ANAGA|nr:hypothetical protein DPX16_18179 [Anabarilius grahami]
MNDMTGFREMLRVTVEEFYELLAMVEPLITRTDTVMRRSISAKERLSVTLRFLATDAYLPPGYTDWEDENHQLHNGAWRQEITLQSVNMGGGKNPTIAAKEQRDHLKEYFVSPAGCVPWQDQYV